MYLVPSRATPVPYILFGTNPIYSQGCGADFQATVSLSSILNGIEDRSLNFGFLNSDGICRWKSVSYDIGFSQTDCFFFIPRYLFWGCMGNRMKEYCDSFAQERNLLSNTT